jgi:hypothetical protein
MNLLDLDVFLHKPAGTLIAESGVSLHGGRVQLVRGLADR